MKTLTSSGCRFLGSHLELVPELVQRVRSLGVDAPIIVGGIIPDEDQPGLIDNGVAAVTRRLRTGSNHDRHLRADVSAWLSQN